MRVLQTRAGKVQSLRYSPDGRSLHLLGTGQNSEHPGLDLQEIALRIDTSTGAVVGSWTFSGSEVAVFTPDLRAVYHSVSVAVSGGELDLWRVDLFTGKREFVYASQVPYPNALAFTPNGHILAISGQYWAGGSGEWAVHRLDVWHKIELAPIRIEAHCVDYSSDGRVLATGCMNHGAKTWDGRQLVEEFAGRAAQLVLSSDGRLAWGMGGQLNVARPSTREQVRTWGGAAGELSALGFSPDGRLLLTGTDAGVCALHDAVAGRMQAAFDWAIGPIHSVAFSPDGLTCAAGGEKGQVVVWDVDG